MAGGLNSRIGFVQAASAWKVQLTSHSLPAEGNCPLCRDGRMLFQQDMDAGGIIAYCRGCHFSGDFVALGKAVWKCNTTVCVSHLQTAGALPVAPGTQALVKNWDRVNNARESANALVSRSMRAGRVLNDAGARAMLNRLAIGLEPTLTWNEKTVGGVVGFALSEDIEDAFRPRRDTSPRHTVPRKPRVSPTGCDASLIIPFYDVPGRVASASFVSHHRDIGERRSDYFLPLDTTNHRGTGLAYHPDTFRRSRDNRVLLTSDTDIYLRTHIRQFNVSPTILPLVCYRLGEHNTRCWQQLKGRDLVFWLPKISPRDLWQAIKLDARITSVGPIGATYAEYLKARDAAVVVDQCFKTAKPWPEALSALIESKDTHELADFMSQMSLSHVEQERVIAACAPRLRDKLVHAITGALTYKTVPLADGYIEQRASGWYMVKQGRGEQLITDTPFRITEAIHCGSAVEYNVEATLNQKAFTFQCPFEEFSKRPFEIVQREAIKGGIGDPTFDPSWQRQAVHIAKQLHTPVARKKTLVVGYDPGDDSLTLPFLRIDGLTGSIYPDASGDPSQPSATLRHSRIDRRALQSTLNEPDAVAPLSVFLGLTGQIVAMIAGRPVPRIGLLGRSARIAAMHVSESLGLLQNVSINPQAVTTQAKRHQWPLAVGLQRQLSLQDRKQVMQHKDELPIMMPLSMHQFLYSQIVGGGTVIQSKGYEGLQPEQLEVFGPLLLNCLSFMFNRGLQGLADDNKGTAYGAYRLVKAYTDSIGLEPGVLSRAVRACPPCIAPTKHLAEAVITLIHEEKMSFSDDLADVYNGFLAIHPDNGSIVIPHRTVMRHLMHAGCPAFDLSALSVRLTNATTSCSMQMVNRTVCWLMNKQQFDAQRSVVSIRRNELRLISA